jgi:hypothetical protein
VGEEDLPTKRSIIDASTGIKRDPTEFPDTQRILRRAEEINANQWFARTYRETATPGISGGIDLSRARKEQVRWLK